MAEGVPLSQVLLDLSSRMDETLARIPPEALFVGHFMFACSLFKHLKNQWLQSVIITFVGAVGGGLSTTNLTYQRQVLNQRGSSQTLLG